VSALPADPTAKDIGTHLETVVADRLGFERVGADQAGHLDARTPDGAPVEIKGARRRISRGDREGYGRWWIQRSNHRQLRREDGFYALAVYSLHEGPALAVEHLAVVPARVLGSLVPGWTPIPADHVAETDDAAQLTWTRIFGGDSA
jgi:hypothetical protein